MALPSWSLRDLTLRVASSTTDAYGATVPDTDTDTTIKGRIDQSSRTDSLAMGRVGEVSTWLLLTNVDTLNASDRIVDGSHTYEIDGPPWPAYGGTGIHHYEASLKLMEG